MKQGVLSCLLGFSIWAGLAYAQSVPGIDAIDQKIIEIQKQIDQKGYHWTADRTSTAEMPLEDFRRLLGAKPPKGYDEWLADQPKLTAKSWMSFPTYFDWRDSGIVTAVKSQASCGSCWDFAATGAFEAAVKKHDGIEYDLSEQQVLSCNIYESGCGGGAAESVYELFQRYGAVSETCMPYQANDAVPCAQEQCEIVVKLGSWQYVDNDVTAIKEAVLTGPVYTTFAVYEDFRYYSSGCYQHTWGGFEGWHAVVIVGWDDNACGTGNGAWICKNSWGDWWGGLDGFFIIKWNDSYIGGSTVLPLYPPDPVTITYEDNDLTELSGDGDGAVEPGETATLMVSLGNTGLTTATSVAGTLQTSQPGVSIIDGEAIFPDIPFNGIVSSAAPHFVIQTDESIPAGSRIDFTLDITCDQGDFTSPLYGVIGKFETVFFDDMESGDNGWVHGGAPDQWARGVPGGGCPTDPTEAYSPENIWGTGLSSAYERNATTFIESPTIDCSEYKKTRLQFRRWLAVEKGIYDGAFIYINGTMVWRNDLDADIIDTRWRLHDLDISLYADSNASVKIKFYLTSDVGLQLGGWNIDDFAVVGIKEQSYVTGDASGDGIVNVADAVFIIGYVFRGGSAPEPLLAGDSNCDLTCNVADGVYVINYVFKGGPPPCEP